MSTGKGVTSKAAFEIENTAWGTSKAVGSGDQIHFISESISHAIEQAQSIHKDGNIGAKNLYPIFKKYGGDLLIEAHYAGLEKFIAIAMGMSHQDLSPVSTSTDAHEHYFELSEDMSTRAFDGYEKVVPSGDARRRGTLCLEKDVSVWELASAMCNAMNFEANPERITFSFTLAGKTIAFDSPTNLDSSSWMMPSNTEQIVWEDMTVYLKARDKFTIISTNDNFIIDDGGGDVTLDIADGTYTGYELAQLIAAAANADGSISGVYKMEYDEQRRRFRLYTTDGQTFSVTGTSMDMADTVGMTVDSTTTTETESDFDAVPDAFAAFSSSDKIGISKITFAQENSLDIESQDSKSDLYILEPERNGPRRITGTIDVPRYKNDDWLKAVSGYTTYLLWIKFAGSAIDSESYEMNIYMPAIKFTNADAPITGAELIKQTLAFEAEMPDIIDFVNFAFPAYNFRNTATAAAASRGASPYKDGYLYGAGEDGIIAYWDGDSWTTSTDTGADIHFSLQQYDGKLYVGANNGIIKEFDGTTWSSSTDVGSGIIMRMALYDGKLYAIEVATGKIFENDTGTWSLSCDTTSTVMEAISEYRGSLYAVGSDNSAFTRVYKFDGTTWSTSTDFGSGSSVMAIAEHCGKLYVSANDDLFVFDNDAWTVEKATLGLNVNTMISFKGNLILFADGGNADAYYYDFGSDAAVNIYTSLNLTDMQNAIIYQGNLFIQHKATAMKMFIPIKEMLITIQNQNGTNPL